MTLQERFDEMLTRPDRFESVATEHLIIDTRDHLRYFREVAKGNVLEIGCDVGNSTTAFLLGAEENKGHVFSIDINPKCANNFPGHPRWEFIYGSSRDLSVQDSVAKLVHCYGQFDVLYVDGDHSYQGTRGDIEVYAGFVRPGGLVLVHDILHPEFPDVWRAFIEFEGAKYKAVRQASWGLGVIQL